MFFICKHILKIVWSDGRKSLLKSYLKKFRAFADLRHYQEINDKET